MRTKTIKVFEGEAINIGQYPNFHRTGSIIGMKRMFYGKDATLIKCGNYIYNVPKEIWDKY